MNRVLLVTRQNLLRCLRDPAALVLWFIIPLMIGALLVLAMGGSNGPKPQVHLLIADQDDSFGSRLLIRALTSDRAGEFIRAEKVDEATGRRRMEHGDASALLIIPPGFARAVLREEPTTLQLITNPAERILPGIAEEMLRLFSETVFYLHRLLGPQMRQFAQGPPPGEDLFSDADVARLSASINDTMRQLRKYLFPPVIKLETVVPVAKPAKASDGSGSFALNFLPGIVFMALLFTAQGLSNDIWREREHGLLRRVVTTPLDLLSVILGKLLAAVIVVGVIAGVILAGGMEYLDVPFRRWPAAVAWSAASGAGILLLLLLLQMFAGSHRAASFLSFSIMFPLLMLGGSMFPTAFMPPWMAAIGRWTPNGWAAVRLTDILTGRITLPLLAAAFGGMALTVAVLVLANHWRLARGFARR